MPSARPAILHSVSRSASQMAENTVPNRGAVELRIASRDAGRYRAAKLYRRIGMPEFTIPMTRKCFQLFLHSGLKRVTAKKPARATPAGQPGSCFSVSPGRPHGIIRETLGTRSAGA